MFDPKCAEFEAKIASAKTWAETRELMVEYHQWFSSKYKWDKDIEKWVEL